jgi:hypothetical protein
MVGPYSNHKKTPEKKKSIMDDITYGQWSKKHYNNDDDYDGHNNILNDETLDPYTMQKSFRKIAKKLSRSL